ncbi:polyomavirus large T like protein [Japanese eel endothelial cells-infecting virus]|uniref:large T antigen n=1 Tax=Japanese eel endothelial cells-infecting virus TaxID=712037 RepID=UPI0001F7E3D2|nr:large T antigen [Japanese eel endothelial cells-infecting virus]BAJ72716.1 polyomavirus large T like protein [Japanese eel endothelial cells-infecting virus]BAS53725.1 polyomavirus large T like protein [Japanese eel endothelial cells-infecting virus]BAS53726.1 polyomavirus large T like protein [Japanese eel endothelial cells-infecting virus]
MEGEEEDAERNIYLQLNIFLFDDPSFVIRTYQTYKKAHKAACLRYHPDKNTSCPPEERQRLEQRLKRINEVWAKYMDIHQRQQTWFDISPSKRGGTLTVPEYLAKYCTTIQDGQFVQTVLVQVPWAKLGSVVTELKKYKHVDLIAGGDPREDPPTGIAVVQFVHRQKESALKGKCNAVTLVCNVMQVANKSFTTVKQICLAYWKENTTEHGHVMEDETNPVGFDYTMLEQFACAIECTDELRLIGEYLACAYAVEDCFTCRSDQQKYAGSVYPEASHIKLHAQHMVNAQFFKAVHNKKGQCQNATNTVIGIKRHSSASLSRQQQFEQRVLKALKQVRQQIDTSKYAAAVALNHMLPLGMTVNDFCLKVLQRLITHEPKKSGIIFKGPMNTGKTTIAHAVLDMCSGTVLNMNGEMSQVRFELGRATGQFMVVFEDVTGVPEADHPELTAGAGMLNMDGIRDHLDCTVMVGLERKYSNKVDQYFPPWIATMNEYKIPQGVSVRSETYHMTRTISDLRQYLVSHNVQTRFMSSGQNLALMLALYADASYFTEEALPIVEELRRKGEEYDIGAMEQAIRGLRVDESQEEEREREEEEFGNTQQFMSETDRQRAGPASSNDFATASQEMGQAQQGSHTQPEINTGTQLSQSTHTADPEEGTSAPSQAKRRRREPESLQELLLIDSDGMCILIIFSCSYLILFI